MKTVLLRSAARSMCRMALVLVSLPACGAPAMAAGCVVSTSGIAFGSYDPLQAAALDSAAELAVRCTAPTAYGVALGMGAGRYDGRLLSGGGRGAGLVYNLFVDASRTTVWGDGSASTALVSGVAPDGGVSARHAVYGRIPARQNLPAGTYSDSVGILVSY